MKVTGHGNALAIAIATLALVLAGTGAAVAVTSTTTISDPTTPSRIAHVDGGGRLATVGSTTAISIQGYVANSGTVNMTSPTTASLAITQLALSETRQNANVAGSDLTVRLVQNTVNSTGQCTTIASRYLAVTVLSAGDHVDLAPSAPLVVKPIGGAKYCLGLYSVVTNGAVDATTFYPYYTLGAYTASGTYTGLGQGATPGAAALPRKKTR